MKVGIGGPMVTISKEKRAPFSITHSVVISEPFPHCKNVLSNWFTI